MTERELSLRENEVITVKTRKAEIRIYRRAKGTREEGYLHIEVRSEVPLGLRHGSQNATIYVNEKTGEVSPTKGGWV